MVVECCGSITPAISGAMSLMEACRAVSAMCLMVVELCTMARRATGDFSGRIVVSFWKSFRQSTGLQWGLRCVGTLYPAQDSRAVGNKRTKYSLAALACLLMALGWWIR